MHRVVNIGNAPVVLHLTTLAAGRFAAQPANVPVVRVVRAGTRPARTVLLVGIPRPPVLP